MKDNLTFSFQNCFFFLKLVQYEQYNSKCVQQGRAATVHTKTGPKTKPKGWQITKKATHKKKVATQTQRTEKRKTMKNDVKQSLRFLRVY